MRNSTGHLSPNEYLVLRGLKLFGNLNRQQLYLYFCLEGKRSKALETLLPKMEKAGELAVTWFKGEKVYALPRKNRKEVASTEHELGVGETMIRLWRCRMDEAEVVPHRSLRGFAIVADGAFVFSDKRATMLLIEFHTLKNFLHSSGGVLKSKLTRYQKHLPATETFFQRSATVLFVVDAPRMGVLKFIGRAKKLLDVPIVSKFSGEARYPYFFVDFDSFKAAPIGKTMSQPIFFWHDGKEWALSHD